MSETANTVPERVPGHIPVLRVSRTLIGLNGALLQRMPPPRRVRLEIVGGRPVLYPDPTGKAVTPGGVESGGYIQAPTYIRKAQALGVGSRWEMEWNATAGCWVGKRLTRERLAEARREIERRPELCRRALDIVRGWRRAMDHPDSEPPLEVHHQDLDVIEAALTVALGGGRPPGRRR